MYVETSGFAKDKTQIKQIRVIFNHLKLWVAEASHNQKWVIFFLN